MTVSTTLMTFLVRTPPTTRSVDLFGSWDNFSTPYPMSRDIRLGKEHWTGCHSFENIICDGNVDDRGFLRRGGLKMGGTYWYYYKLDDEIEFHNSAEPATTRCPLLPGQLVNELQVPFAFSGSRKRDASISSTSSEQHTLDPDAHFVNPRPVPTPPKLMRLNTSPTLLQSPYMDKLDVSTVSAAPLLQTNRDEQFKAATSRIFHLPRKPSLDALLKIGSAKRNPASLRPAFQSPGASNSATRDAKYQDIIDWVPGRQEQDFPRAEPVILADESRARPPRGMLLLRNNSDEVVTLSSFREHRRQQSRSRSRGRSSRSSGVFDRAPALELTTKKPPEPEVLSALIEVNTPEYTPAYGPMTGRRIALEALEGRSDDEVQLEKRLPTLPNTPSSAYPQTEFGNSPPRRMALEDLEFDSRFSSTTIDTTCHLDSIIMDQDQHSRFLDSKDDPFSSPSSVSTIEDTISSSTMQNQCPGPALRPISSTASALTEMSDSNDYQSSRVLSSIVSCTTISSSISTTPTTSYSEVESGEVSRFSFATTIRSSGASYTPFQHYSLPDVQNASEVTLKHFDSKDYAVPEDEPSQRSRYRSSLSHSETMQQLLNELSYLSDMIQR